MFIRKIITENSGTFFITFTITQWMPLFKTLNVYWMVYKFFDVLKTKGHFINAYVIMPEHVHFILSVQNSTTSINMLMSNGKRFIAYELVKELHVQGQFEVLDKMKSMVNTTDKLHNKKHEVFEPSFNCKPCYSKAFTYQKVEYIHYNPCKTNIASCRL